MLIGRHFGALQQRLCQEARGQARAELEARALLQARLRTATCTLPFLLSSLAPSTPWRELVGAWPDLRSSLLLPSTGHPQGASFQGDSRPPHGRVGNAVAGAGLGLARAASLPGQARDTV